MFEKVNPSHPDKIADRIAGAIVDYAYTLNERPKVAIEVLIGHGICHIMGECSENLSQDILESIVKRITKRDDIKLIVSITVQDEILAKNQDDEIRCGDNGIFKGALITYEERQLSMLARGIYSMYPTDGKYILTNNKLIICQSNARTDDIVDMCKNIRQQVIVNPLGDWTGGLDVDSGATNRKLGSDMGLSITGGGLHGKDLSKADVTANIYAFIMAQKETVTQQLSCAIGDMSIDGGTYIVMYKDMVNIVKNYIDKLGGFEKLAEWGLI